MLRRIATTALLLAVLLAGLFAASPAAHAATTYFYTPQSYTNISGRAFADADCPAHLMNMSTYGCTANAVSQAITGWNLGDFTNVYSPTPLADYQRGINNAQYGGTAVQVTDTELGGQLHSWSIPGGSGYNYNLANLQAKYKWDYADNIRPWAHSTSSFQMSFNLKIPAAYMTGTGTCGYVYASVLVQEPSGKYFWIQNIIFDTRGAPNTEYVGWDAGTNSGYANSFYNYNQVNRYCTKHAASNWSTGTTWTPWRWYSASVSRTQLQNMIYDLNTQFGSGLTTDPSQYRMLLISVQNEMYWPSGNGNISFAVKDIYAMENY